MNSNVRMGAVLVLVAIPIGCLVADGPAYFHSVHAATLAHRATMPQPPSLLLAASVFGFIGWLLAVFQQWRQRQVAWIVASFLLSYLAVAAYAIVSLLSGRRLAANA